MAQKKCNYGIQLVLLSPEKKTRNAMHGFITSVSHKLEALSIAYMYMYIYLYIYQYHVLKACLRLQHSAVQMWLGNSLVSIGIFAKCHN